MRLKMKSLSVMAAVGLIAAASSSALAQSGPPAMPAITFPVDTASIATVVAAAGTTLLLGYFGMRVGFSFVKKLLGRLHRSV